MMKLTKKFSLFLMLAATATAFAGCNKNKNNENKPDEEIPEEIITEAINASSPIVSVDVGEYEHLEGRTPKDVDAITSKRASSSILDMPRTDKLYVVYDYTAQSEVQASPMLMHNLVEANKQLHTISVTDRDGNLLEDKNNLLSTDGEKIMVSAPAGGYEYGEVYQVAINDAPFLCFENKDPSIRIMTLEIEDDPSEAATYDIKDKKTGITNIDRTKVIAKSSNEEEQTYTFVYDGALPNFEEGDVFYATIEGKENAQLDFYGVYKSQETNEEGNIVVTYTAPTMDDIYNNLRMKGESPIDIEHDAELLLDEEVATRQFKQSSLARGVARALLPVVDNNIAQITNILSNFQIHFNINFVNNRCSMKFSAGIYNYKCGQKTYVTVDFGYEKITDYSVDFDLKIRTKWIIPVGVDYKLKCIEETQEIFFLKSTVSIGVLPEKPATKEDFTDAIIKEIDAVESGSDGSVTSCLGKDPEAKAATSGSKTSWPLLVVDIYYFTPLSVRFKIDFYIDAGFQAMMSYQTEAHSKKVDFCWSNMKGANEDADNTISKTSNWYIAFAGNFHFEVGLRVSLSFSVLGLHDFLHAEAYAEFFINASISGLVVADISLTDTSTEFSGYITVDFAVTIGMRVGVDFKFLFVHQCTSRTLWFFYLFRMMYENAMEHWSTIADPEINMTTQTLNINDTNVLVFNCFNSVTMGFEEKKFKGGDKLSIFSGIILSKDWIESKSGHIFTYEVLDHPEYLKCDENGLLHVVDEAPAQFDARLKIMINNWAGFVEDRIVLVHFHDQDAHEIYISYAGGHLNPGAGYHEMVKYVGELRQNQTLIIPGAPKREGFKFMYYDIVVNNPETGEKEYVKENQMPGMTFKMTYNGTVELLAWYEDLVKHTVTFYDGEGNLVYTDIVYEGETANAPYPAMRDRFMDTTKYSFICWNRALDDITEDTEIYGIYMAIGG